MPVAFRTARLTFLGDALCQLPLLAAHETPCGHDFRPVFAPLRDFLADSDFVVANLETPLSEDGGNLTHERWRFNSPRVYAEALQWAGVDFVTTANNHCLDRGTAGLAATIRVLDSIALGMHAGGQYNPAATARTRSPLTSAPLRKPSPAVPSRTSRLRTSIRCSIRTPTWHEPSGSL